MKELIKTPQTTPKKLKYECKKSYWFSGKEQFTEGKTYKGIPYKDTTTGEQRVEMYGYGTDFVAGFGESDPYFDVLSPLENNDVEDDVDAVLGENIEQISLDI